MAVRRSLTVRDKRMIGLVIAVIFILYFLKVLWPKGFVQLSNALRVDPDRLDKITGDLSQVGEGFVLFRVLGSVLAKGWTKTLAVTGSLIYALEGVASLLIPNFDLSTLWTKKNG